MAKQEYIEKNRQWLAEKAREAGVTAIDKGICYKPIKSGKGAQPLSLIHISEPTRQYS